LGLAWESSLVRSLLDLSLNVCVRWFVGYEF
jgi:hypothetical protein